MNRRAIIRTAAAIMILSACAGPVHSDDGADHGAWRRFLEWRAQRLLVTDSYLVSSAGAGYAALQDTRMTPLVYRAVGFAAFAQVRTYRPREVVLADAFFQIALPDTYGTAGGPTVYLNPRGTIDVAYLRSVADLPLVLGGSLSLTGNWRQLDSLGNSSRNYDLVVSLSPTAEWERGFRLLGRPAVWHVRATTPVFSWVLRHPEYNLSYSGNQTLWAAPWDFYRLRLGFGLSRLMQHSEENRLRLDYHYDFYGIDDDPTGHRLTVGNHSLTLGYATKTR